MGDKSTFETEGRLIITSTEVITRNGRKSDDL